MAINDYQRKPLTPEQQLLQMGTVQFPAPAPVVQRPGLLGEFVRANKAGLGSVVSGIGQTAADVLPGVGQGNSLIQAGNELSDANQSSIQSFGDIVRNPLTAASTAAGFATSSIAARFAARAAGRAVLAATPALTGVNPILGAVAAGTGAALYTLGPWAVSAAQGVGAIARRQFEKDPENAASPGATAARLVGGGLTGALEGFGAERFIPGAGGVLAGAIRPGGLASRVAQGIARAGFEEAVEEVPQSIVEQVASFDNPLSAKSLQETAFQATMGAMGGGVVGGTMAGAFGPRPAQPTIPPQNIPTEDLGRSVDEILALPPPGQAPSSGFVTTPGGRTIDRGEYANHLEQMAQLRRAGRGAEATAIHGQYLAAPPEGAPAEAQPVAQPASPAPTPGPFRTQTELPGLEPMPAPTRADFAQPVAAPGAQFNLPFFGDQPPPVPPPPAPFAALPVAAIPKGLPSAYKTAFEQAATPEDLATRIRKVFYDKAVVGQSAARYVLGEGQSNLMSMYQAVTGQEMPSSEALAQEFEPADVEAAPAVPPPQAIPETPVASAPVAEAPLSEAAQQPAQTAHASAPADVSSAFTTAKGSTYVVHSDQTTTRNKAPRDQVGHEGDSGLKTRSAKTVYVDGTAAPLSAAGLSGLGEKGARVAIKDGKATLVTWNEAQGRWGAASSSTNIPIYAEPAVGRSPLELWRPTMDVPGYEAYSVMHAGNPIVGGGEQLVDTDGGSEVGQQPAPVLPKLTLTKAKRMLALPPGQLAPESRAYVEQYVRETEAALAEARTLGKYDSKPGEFTPAEKELRKKGKNTPAPGTVETIDGAKHIPFAAAVEAARQMVADGLPGDLATNINERLGLRRADAKRVASEVRKTTPQASRTSPAQTLTDAFRRWFRNSQVVDAEGKPLVVYHGTDTDFAVFDLKQSGRKDSGWYGQGIYFTADPETASAYADYWEGRRPGEGTSAPNVVPAYLSIQRPYIWPDARPVVTTREDAAALTTELIAAGYDGVIVPNSFMDEGAKRDFHEVVAFRPEQIKSAVGNQGTFDPSNPNILRSGRLGSALPAGPHTVTTIREAISRIIGRAAMTRLAKKFVIVADSAALRIEMARRGSDYVDHVDGTEKGLYDPSTQTSYIVASNMAATDSPWGVFLHEVGAHYGLSRLLGEKGHSSVLRDVNRLLRTGDPALVAAAQQVNVAEQLGLDPNAPDFATQFADRVLGDSRLGEETIAYMAENPANHNRSVWKRIVTAVRNFLRSLGVTQPITSDDIAVMVIAAARKTVDAPQAPTGQRTTMVQNAQDVLTQFGYTARTAQDGTVDILDANGQVVSEADIPDTLQLAATIIKYPAIRAELDKDVAAHGPMFSRTTAAASALPETPRTAYEAVGDFANIARGLLAKLVGQPANSMSTNVLKAAVGWMDKRHFVEMYDTTFKEGIKQNAAADDLQEAATSRINQMFNSPYHKIQEMQRSDRAAFDIINELMMSTEQHIDPRKTWEQQEHLHELEGRQLDQVREQVKLARQKYGRLSPSAKAVYEDLVNMNETLYLMDMAISLQNLVHAQIPETAIPPVFRTNAMSEFNRRAEAHKDIQAAKKYWSDVLDSYVAATDKHIDDLRGKLPQGEPETPEFKASVRAALKGVTDPKLRKRIQAMLRSARRTSTDKAQAATVKHLMPLEAQLVGIQKGLTAIGQAPYFHMGRFGDFFVAFKVKADGEGQADPRAMQAVYAALHARFPDIVLRSDGLDPNVFARFESSAQAEQFKKAVQELQRQGHIPPVGTLTKDGKTDLGTIFAGPREGAFGEPQRVGPEMLHRILESIQDDDYEPGVAARLRADMQALYLDSLPDTSAVKFLQRRKGRQGFAADMLRSYAHRMYSGSSRVAGLSVQPLREQSFRTMNAVLQDSLANPNMSEDDKSKQKIIVEELRRRERERTQQPHTPALSMLRSVNHAFFLALSPAFVATQVAQVGILAWPELAKRHGFAKAAKAITKVTPEATKILIAAIREGYKTRGWHGATDMVLTDDILKAANLSPGVEAFIVEMMATGKLDIGNATRELARVAEGEVSGEKTTKAAELLKMATATSYGSELFTRTIVALAAKELHQGSGAVEYAANVVDNAMFNYNITNIARLTGKKGVIGPYTPVALSFKQYPLQLLTKLYREIYRAVGEREGVTATQAKEARTFLKAHATAMVATSGVLGLPFATAVAALVDHLCELFSDVPCDTKTSIRNFTADVVGHDLEPLVTRGLPRILGADVSNRLTEADVIPFSRFMADRREMSEKLKLLAWDSYGAPASMIGNVITGLETAMSGDILGGAQKALPSFLRGPANAISAASRGFTDNQQNQLPITPHTADILWQMLGIAPGRLTDYNEARFAQTQRTGLLDREAAKIRRNLVVAIEQQDRAAMLKYARQAQEYQQNNPGRSILPNIGSAVQQRQRARAIAGATGLPIGANPRDLGARSFTSYYRPEAVQ